MADYGGSYAGPNPGVYAATASTKDVFASFAIPPGSRSSDPDPPVISNVLPTPGTMLASRTTPITFRVVDSAPGLRLVVVTLRYVGETETIVVHDGSVFLAAFADGASTRTGIAGGYDFSLSPRGGWHGAIASLRVYAVDGDGNLEGGLP